MKQFKFKYLWNLAASYKKEIFLLFVLGLFSSLFSLATPYISKLFIDKAFLDKNMGNFLRFSFLGAGIFVFTTLIKIVNDVIKNKISIRIKLGLSTKFIRKFYSLDLDFFNQRAVGENIYRLSDTDSVANFILEQSPAIILDIVKVPIILGICLWLNSKLTILLLILSPLFILHSAFIQKKLQPVYEHLWQYSAKLSKEINEAFSKIMIIKAFNLEKYQQLRYTKSLIENIRLKIKSFRWSIINSLSSSLLSKIVFGVVTIYGGWLIIKGKLSLGSYTAVMIYLSQLGGLLESLGYRFGYFANELVSISRFYEIMDIEPKIKDDSDAVELSFVKGAIEFNNLTFSYNQEKRIFSEFNIQIPESSWIGIAGPSGCGKTTLINLILRLYDPQNGQVFLDGQPLKKIKLKSLRKNIAIATQQPLLFDLSVKDNIRYGDRRINDAEVEKAARLAVAHEFILSLPHGYDTLIGEDACRLSQGQRQRISIARAVAKGSRILILDEATSSVDLPTEEMIFNNLRQLRQKMTTIIITHRAHSLINADCIYFFDQGRVEKGTHEELFKTSPAYQKLFSNQVKL